MRVIHYPDGGIGMIDDKKFAQIKENPPMTVINPGERMSSKHRFLMSVDGKPVEVNGGLKKIEAKDIIASMKTEMKDASGKKVKQISYIKTTGEILPPGSTGRKHVNEEGKDVPSGEIHTFQVMEDGTEVEISEFEKTDVIELVKTLPAGSEDAYLIEEEYELMPDSDKDKFSLWEIAKSLHDKGEIATGVAVQRRGWNKYGVLIIPKVIGGKFAVIVKLTKSKYEIPALLDIPTGAPAPTKKKTGKEVDTGTSQLFS